MPFLVDASVLIAAQGARLNLTERIAGREEESFGISVVTVTELLQGVYRADTPDRLARGAACVEALLDRVPVLPVDLETARAHALLWADLAARDAVIAPHDLWLAATCVAHGLTLVTTDPRSFDQVPGLVVERW
jgi:tRNA(fMet)-specific endonuclease VapC